MMRRSSIDRLWNLICLRGPECGIVLPANDRPIAHPVYFLYGGFPMSEPLDSLAAQVTETASVESAAATKLQQLASAGSVTIDPAQLIALRDQLKASSDALAAVLGGIS